MANFYYLSLLQVEGKKDTPRVLFAKFFAGLFALKPTARVMTFIFLFIGICIQITHTVTKSVQHTQGRVVIGEISSANLQHSIFSLSLSLTPPVLSSYSFATLFFILFYQKVCIFVSVDIAHMLILLSCY